ncbi:MAG: 3-isopropylmalate dehydrogenase [Bacteroidota bacterium]|nr:3-isopropylmalate dehydrogenase [Candidatus Kapabacteria bacterium]MDW8219075.1 3-isopropylmalate dehydrogenase [Bacteroidota bacterium]
MNAHIVVVAGDGIGPEVTHEAVRSLEAIATRFQHTFVFEHHLIGGAAIDATGSALPNETLQAALKADAVLLGAVGGPQWDNPQALIRPEDGLLGIRKALQLYANLRPVRVYTQLAEASPLKQHILAGVDFIVVRELTGGLYFGQPKERRIRSDGGITAIDTLEYHDYEIDRILQLAFELAASPSRRGMLASVDKANVLETSRLWRERAQSLAQHYPSVTLQHILVDTAAMRLVMSPSQFDVIVTENTFGDILTDEAAVLTGSMGLLPSASLGQIRNSKGFPLGLYEPIHGSAPDIAGKGIANPIGTILSAALLLRYSLGLEHEAQTLEHAVEHALANGARTVDISAAHALSTSQMTEEILNAL